MLILLTLAASLITATMPTCDPVPKGDREFLQELVAGGFRESRGTVDSFITNGDKNLTLSLDEQDVSIDLVFTRKLAHSLITCDVVISFKPSLYQLGRINAVDQGADGAGWVAAEEAFYKSVEVFQTMIGSASKVSNLV